MEENVIISIRGKQAFAEASPDVIELVTEGQLTARGDGRYTLTYRESELTGLEGTTTVFEIDGGRVTLLREGEVNSQMVFECPSMRPPTALCPWASAPGGCAPT